MSVDTTAVPVIAPPAGPIRPAERIEAIDVLRGVAVLGILVMNVQSFAMIGAAYMNPMALGELRGADYIIWLLGHVFADRKFMTIFSVLFGAGIVLMTERRAAAGCRTAAVHYRRMFWLMVIGLMHAYLLWFGDVLFLYGACGLFAYLCRRWRLRTLLVFAVLGITIPSAIRVLWQSSLPYWPAESLAYLNDHTWQPSADVVAGELAEYRGGYLAQMPYRFAAARSMQLTMLPLLFLWRALGLMLAGMALYKLGTFSARASARTYWFFVAVALLIGLPLTVYGVYWNTAVGWDVRYCFFLGAQFNYWASLPVSLGWVGAVMLVCRAGVLAGARRVLAAVGRMALTNYLLQTVICTTLFYGHGLGLYGYVGRTGQLAVVLAVSAVQLVLSPLWLWYFRFGPLEWLWRSLTYWRWQPLRVASGGALPEAHLPGQRGEGDQSGR
ncbi:MAG: DUF418 domain-containing protein [Phycisphaerae bacterium]